MRAELVGWIGCGALCVAAVTVDLSAPRIEAAPEASSDAKKHAFYMLASEEAFMRKGAAKSFPTDPWSQDDDFHNREFRRLQALATSDHVSVTSMLRAIDDGARERWPQAPGSVLDETVPPCRPRPIY